MTAEISILNKTAIALAADSAVTITGSGNQKIYNTANKLFTLTKYHPVGIMVYGNSELMGIPWESIIKIYRSHISSKSFSNLEEYGKDFIEFIDNNNPIFPAEIQDNYFKNTIFGYFDSIKNNINKRIENLANRNKKININEIKNILKENIDREYSKWKNAKKMKHLQSSHPKKILDRYIKSLVSGKK